MLSFPDMVEFLCGPIAVVCVELTSLGWSLGHCPRVGWGRATRRLTDAGGRSLRLVWQRAGGLALARRILIWARLNDGFIVF